MCFDLPVTGAVKPLSPARRGHTDKSLHSRCQSAIRTLGTSGETGYQAGQACPGVFIMGNRLRWWRQTGSNRRPEACKATALPTELCPQLEIPPLGYACKQYPIMVGLGGLEPPTSRLSSARSNQLSYKPQTTLIDPNFIY